MTDMNRDALIRRAAAASRLLGDDTVLAALAEIEADCIAAWSESNPRDVEQREDAFRMHRCAGLIRQKLEAWRASGHVEKDNAAGRLREVHA